MAKKRTPESAPAQAASPAVVDELKALAASMDAGFSYYAPYMEMLRLDAATVVHGLARAGESTDAHRLIDRVKSSSRRRPLRALALAHAERGEFDAARQAACELPPTGAPHSARSTLVELVNVQARYGDFDGAAQAAEELEDVEQSTRSLIDVAQLRAEAEVGNFAQARVVPQEHTSSAWVTTADLFARAGERGPAEAGSVRLMKRAAQRAKGITKNADKSLLLSVVAHRLAWFGNADGAAEAARLAEGTVGQEKGLAYVVQALAGRGDLAAAEKLAAGLKGKAGKADAEMWIAGARAGHIGRSPAEEWSWQELLKAAAGDGEPDSRITGLVDYAARHTPAADASKALLDALLRMHPALTEGGQAVKDAGLRDELLTTCVFPGERKWKGSPAGEAGDVEAARLARLCRIAGAQAVLGDFDGAAQTARLIADADFRACALALALSGHHESKERLRHAPKS